MAVLNKYIENRKYNLTDEAKDFKHTGKVHPSRLLNPLVFSLSESPIYEGGLINIGSLAMASKAYSFLQSFRRHNPELIKDLLTSVIGGWKNIHLGPIYKLSKSSQEVIRGIDSCKFRFEEDFAIVTEFILRNFPEDGKIVESDRSRNNPYNWVDLIEENEENLYDYGFDVVSYEGSEAVEYLAPHESFTPNGINITEKQFTSRVSNIAESASKINFAIETACSILNLLNYKFFKHELMEFEPEPDEQKDYLDTISKPQSQEDNFAYCPRMFEANFRKRKYNYLHKLPRSEDGYTDYSFTSTPYFNFLKTECKVYSEDVRKALRNLSKHKVSVRYKGKQLEALKTMAELYPKYLDSRKTVLGWYTERFGVVDDIEMEEAMEFVLTNYEKVTDLVDVRTKINMTLFVADQRVVADAKNKDEELPAISEIKTEMDAVEKLGPHLDKLGLKIVPKDVKTHGENQIKTIATDVGPILQKARNIFVHGKYIEADLSKFPDWMKPKPKPKPTAPIKVSAVNLEQPNVSNETASFDQDFEYNQKVKKWKDTTTYKSFFDKLGGSGECSLVEIGLVKSNKELLTDIEAAERERKKQAGEKVTRGNKMTERSAANSGTKFVKEAKLLPCRNFKNLSRTDAVLKVFEAAYKRKNKITGKSTKANDATALLSKDKDFLVTPDKVLTKHLKKLKVTEKQQTKYLEQVDEIEGTVEGTSNVKYNTEEVAIAFCEGQKKPSDSGQ